MFCDTEMPTVATTASGTAASTAACTADAARATSSHASATLGCVAWMVKSTCVSCWGAGEGGGGRGVGQPRGGGSFRPSGCGHPIGSGGWVRGTHAKHKPPHPRSRPAEDAPQTAPHLADVGRDGDGGGAGHGQLAGLRARRGRRGMELGFRGSTARRGREASRAACRQLWLHSLCASKASAGTAQVWLVGAAGKGHGCPAPRTFERQKRGGGGGVPCARAESPPCPPPPTRAHDMVRCRETRGAVPICGCAPAHLGVRWGVALGVRDGRQAQQEHDGAAAHGWGLGRGGTRVRGVWRGLASGRGASRLKEIDK